MKQFSRLALGALLIAGCLSNPSTPKDMTGTVTSGFERSTFSPTNSDQEHSVNRQSSEAQDWDVFYNIQLATFAEERKMRSEGYTGFPRFYICVSGAAFIKHHENGVGHLGQWDSDVTFTKITSASLGKCDEKRSNFSNFVSYQELE